MTNPVAHTQPGPADTTFLPGPVLLLGAPGVGKGTQAKLLMSTFGIPQISTGDLLRQNVADKTALGSRAKELMDGGQLVPDYLVNQMVSDRLAHPDTKSGFVLDGFPRTLQQATWIDETLSGDRRGFVWIDAGEKPAPWPPVVAISIIVDYEQLLHRITGRRISPSGRIYNIYSNPPKVGDIDDIDGSALIQRPDDTEAVFTERMKTFEAQTAPVVEHYRNQGRFHEVNGDQPVEAVAEAITAALKSLRTT